MKFLELKEIELNQRFQNQLNRYNINHNCTDSLEYFYHIKQLIHNKQQMKHFLKTLDLQNQI